MNTHEINVVGQDLTPATTPIRKPAPPEPAKSGPVVPLAWGQDIATDLRLCEKLAQSTIVPDEYRTKLNQGNAAANMYIAGKLGAAFGLDLIPSLYSIYVINGKPAPSAGLQVALTRKAGHKVRATEGETNGEQWAEVTIIRADDPDFPFVYRFTMGDAQIAGLTSKSKSGRPSNWDKHPRLMLHHRAMTGCISKACPEVVSGIDFNHVEPETDPIAQVPNLAERAVADTPEPAKLEAPVPAQLEPAEVTEVAEAVAEKPEPKTPANHGQVVEGTPEELEQYLREKLEVYGASRVGLYKHTGEGSFKAIVDGNKFELATAWIEANKVETPEYLEGEEPF